MKQFNNEVMTMPNHLAGGAVFTGFFATILFGLNILSTPVMLVTTLVASVLPDCDHTRSPVGKLLYPISKFLNRRFGHRTITHSLPALIGLTLMVSFVEKTYFDSYRVSVVFCLAYWSHLLFDMCTLQGVPLLYPFMKNPFVLIGNPDARIRVGDYRREAMAFSVFLAWGVSLYSLGLFQNGFWTTYNRVFATLEHLHSEFRRSTDLLLVDYVYLEGTSEISGAGYCIESSLSKAALLQIPSPEGGGREGAGVGEWLLLESNKLTIKKVFPTHTGQRLDIRHVDFTNITTDSLNCLIFDKTILSLDVQANQSFQVTEANGFPKTVTSFEGKYLNAAPVLSFPQGSLPNTSLSSPEGTYPDRSHLPQIELLQQKIAIHRREQATELKSWEATQSKIAQLHRQYAATENPLQRQNLHTQIRELETIKPPKFDYTQIEELQNQIRKIEKEAAMRNEAKRQALELKRQQEESEIRELRFTGIVRYVLLQS
jgi:inner membrane protein